MQLQDLAAAMLLYDQINQKGFEGDMVLNGFAEFIRNLLVCKDPKSASLLDVVEGMQDKYSTASTKISLSYLISALNILNEAEINFKMARNNRLHVELTLIKLNFLQQAIDLSVENGNLVKKKRLDGPIAFRTKNILPFQTKIVVPEPSGAKLLIESNKVTEIVPIKSAITKPIPNHSPATDNIETPSNNSGGNKKRLLDSLREKYGEEYVIEEVKDAEILSDEKLLSCWQEYTVLLEKQLKHSSAGTFKAAKLIIEHDLRFTVTVSALTSQKFVEQERMMLLEHLHAAFHNRAINFEVLVETEAKEDIPIHLRLNSKQKFEYISNQYPLVKELKDRLKLEIDY